VKDVLLDDKSDVNIIFESLRKKLWVEETQASSFWSKDG
jgi:hypothetical protein